MTRPAGFGADPVASAPRGEPCSVRPPWRTSGSERFPHSTSATGGGRYVSRLTQHPPQVDPG